MTRLAVGGKCGRPGRPPEALRLAREYRSERRSTDSGAAEPEEVPASHQEFMFVHESLLCHGFVQVEQQTGDGRVSGKLPRIERRIGLRLALR